MLVSLLTPAHDITVHVEQSPVVRLLASHGPRPFLGIHSVPIIFLQQSYRLAEMSAGDRPCPSGILELRFGGKSIACTSQVIGGQSHALFVKRIGSARKQAAGGSKRSPRAAGETDAAACQSRHRLEGGHRFVAPFAWRQS